MRSVRVPPDSALPRVPAQEPAQNHSLLDDDPYEAIREVLARGGPAMTFQPQFSLSRLEVCGYEALARFPEPALDCEPWFAAAHAIGWGAQMEAAAVANALRAGASRPPGTWLAVNVSPSVLGSAQLDQVLPEDLAWFEIEITEHEALLDPLGVRRRLDALRERGARVAIDDVGVGHSGLGRIMQLAPDSLKLDRHLVKGVAHDTAKAALIRAVVDFAAHLKASVCAEGVETMEDLLALADLDVAVAQGWLIGRGSRGFSAVDPVVALRCEESLARVYEYPRVAEGIVDARDRRASAEAGLQTADAERQSLGVSPTPPPSLESWLGRLADVESLDELAILVHRGAAVVEVDQLTLSSLRGGGTAVEAVLPQSWAREGTSYALADFPQTSLCLRERRIVHVRDAPGQCEAERAVLADIGFASVLMAPVTSRGRTIGLLEGFVTGDLPWSRRQVRALRLFASVLGPTLDGLLSQGARPEDLGH